MRILWESLHADLMRSVRSLEASGQFKKVKVQKREMARFEDPVLLVGYLASKGGDLDDKDRIYSALVELGCTDEETADLARTLLWLGLWPGLDMVYRRKLRFFPDAPEELVSEMGSRFTDAVQHADLSKINRVAATLVRNTEREISEGRRRVWARDSKRADLPEGDALHEPDDGEPAYEPSALGLPPGLTTEEETAALRDLLVPLVGEDDADLVLGAAVYGESHREVGERLGLTHEAARKRFRRALDRIRKHLRDKR